MPDVMRRVICGAASTETRRSSDNLGFVFGDLGGADVIQKISFKHLFVQGDYRTVSVWWKKVESKSGFAPYQMMKDTGLLAEARGWVLPPPLGDDKKQEYGPAVLGAFVPNIATVYSDLLYGVLPPEAGWSLMQTPHTFHYELAPGQFLLLSLEKRKDIKELVPIPALSEEAPRSETERSLEGEIYASKIEQFMTPAEADDWVQAIKREAIDQWSLTGKSIVKFVGQRLKSQFGIPAYYREAALAKLAKELKGELEAEPVIIEVVQKVKRRLRHKNPVKKLITTAKVKKVRQKELRRRKVVRAIRLAKVSDLPPEKFSVYAELLVTYRVG